MHPIILKIKSDIANLTNLKVTKETIRIVIKETLQDYILSAIYLDKEYRNLSFIGGTALRKLHGLDRFSEDLDFVSIENTNFEKLGEIIVKHFEKLDMRNVNYVYHTGEKLNRLTIKFPILNELGLSGYGNEKLHVKVESTVAKENFGEIFIPKNLAGFPLIIKSLDLESLMAGKILACLEREYRKGNTKVLIKGRDFYDLIWYMSQKIKPNYEKLTFYNKEYSEHNLFKLLDQKISKITGNDIYEDLKFYLLDRNFTKQWCELFHELYSRYRKNY